jgi:tRNA-specific 2-thiouridylase
MLINKAGARVLVAMSGGLDSTMTAALLHEQGYQVIGLTMKTWDYAASGGQTKETGCCSLDSINDAREVAVRLGFPHYILDIREHFGESVIDYFVEEYLAGRTPNPCVMCNTHIKWDALLLRADQLDCEFIATGHYARVETGADGRRYVVCGDDLHKDQSYVLWGLSQSSLQRTVFPMGSYTKVQIREMARERGYHSLVNKPESYEICFVPDNDYRGFLKRRVPGLEQKVQGGAFVSPQGLVMGKHQGYPFYTVGQRKGLETAFGTPKYVVSIDAERNEVVLGDLEDLDRKVMWVQQLNWQKIPQLPSEGMDAVVKIRYKDAGAPAFLVQEGPQVKVEFMAPVRAIAPGQSAVFYQGDQVLGGGWIHKSLL